MVRTFILAALVVSALACTKKSDQPAASDRPPEPAGTPAEAKPAAVPARRVEPAAVQALLDAWLKAQNEQDYDTYESLYASRFEGVRRSGSRTVRLDRAGWIADRKRMFQKRMSVELRDVEIEPFAMGAAVRFTQRWASGKYEDIGPKLMVIVLEKDALRIAREEMLSSQLLDAAVADTGLADASFAFVIEAGEPYVVLDVTAQKPAKLELVSDDDPVIIKGTVQASELPPEVASWQGERVTDGACVAKIVDFSVIGRVYPHFGTRQEWAGTMEEDGRAYTEQQIAEDAFASSEAVIGGRLEGEGGCSIGAYVYKHGKPGYVAAESVKDPALDAAATRAFHMLGSWKEIQKEFVEDEKTRERMPGDELDEGEAPGPWDGDGPTVNAWKHPTSGTILVAVQAREGEGCGGFFGSLSALFEVKGSLDKPALALVGEPDIGEILDVFDIEGDGSFELVFTQGYGSTVLSSATGDPLRMLSVPFLDCGC
jgi:Domain of unknown function (DUF4440)